MVVEPSGAARPITSDIRNAPKIPATDPTAPPISLRRLTCFTRLSNRMMAPPKATPPKAAIVPSTWNAGPRDAKDQVFVTCMPWLDFTSIQHPMASLATPDIPSLAWGRFRDGPGGLQLPFSVQAHHGFVDGWHIHLLGRQVAAELADIIR